MDKGLDTGDMLLTDRVVLDDKMNVEALHDLLSSRGGKLLIDSMEGVADGSIIPTKQNHEKSTYAPLITKETCEIDWMKSAREIHNLVRGLSPVPGAYTYIEDQKVKILETEVLEEKSDEPGTIIDVSPNGVLVSTGDGTIHVLKLQYPGKKPMSVRDFLNGNEITAKKFKRSVE
jgi:methionyl-tRNA formyltransferase